MIGSRRDFLKLSAASLMVLAGGLPVPFAQAEAYDRNAFTGGAGKGREYIALCAGPAELYGDNAKPAYNSEEGSILAFDVATGEGIEIPVPFFGHTVTQNPARPHHLFAFEKWGKHGALVDLKDRKILTLAEASDTNTFFGHCAFSADGAHVITTEDDTDAPKGTLVLRDADTLKIIQKMESYGAWPHECRTPDGGKTLMVVNGGYKGVNKKGVPNLSWIDFQSGKLLSQIELGATSHVIYTHFELSPDHWICTAGVSNRHNTNLVAFISPDGRVLRPDIPKDILDRIKIEALSIMFLGKNDLVAVTIPQSDMMLVFNYKKQILVEAITLKHPQGVLPAASKNEADANWLVSLASGKMVSVLEQTGKPTVTRDVGARKSSYNAHLSRLYI